MSDSYLVHIVGVNEKPKAIVCHLVSETSERTILINCGKAQLDELQKLFEYISKSIQNNPGILEVEEVPVGYLLN
jgi:hypothetical protein